MTVSKHHFPTSNFCIVINMASTTGTPVLSIQQDRDPNSCWSGFTSPTISHPPLKFPTPFYQGHLLYSLRTLRRPTWLWPPSEKGKGLKWKADLKHFAVPSTFFPVISFINKVTFHRQWFYKEFYFRRSYSTIRRSCDQYYSIYN